MEGYAKLWASIIHSTVWSESDHVRILWITMLAMADSEGYVGASIPGLAAAAKIPLTACESALIKLKSIDPYSRTKDHEGRRIEDADGGWVILNYRKHRDEHDVIERRRQARVRAKNFRERLKNGWQQEIDAQDGKCACCAKDFAVPYSKYVCRDHDHKSGDNRGLVCASCNTTIGKYENRRDQAGCPESVSVYLASWKSNAKNNGVTQTVTLSDDKAEAEAEAEAEADAEALLLSTAAAEPAAISRALEHCGVDLTAAAGFLRKKKKRINASTAIEILALFEFVKSQKPENAQALLLSKLANGYTSPKTIPAEFVLREIKSGVVRAINGVAIAGKCGVTTGGAIIINDTQRIEQAALIPSAIKCEFPIS